MNRKTCLILLAVCAGNLLHGQFLLHPQHLITCDLSALSQGGLGFGYEFQPNAHHGWEVQFSLQRAANVPDNLFHGEFNQYFGQRRTDTVVVWSNQHLNRAEWTYLDDSRPLAPLPEFIPLETRWITLNYTALFPKKEQRWVFFVKPSIFVGHYRYYRVRDDLTLIGEAVTNTVVQPYPNVILTKTHTILYQQKRTMRSTEALLLGVGVQAGVRWMPVRRLVLEGRGGVFLNAEPPYPSATGAPISAFAARVSVSAGFVFGKKHRPVAPVGETPELPVE